jgi:hypothetical protein
VCWEIHNLFQHIAVINDAEREGNITIKTINNEQEFNQSEGKRWKVWKLILPNSVIWYHAYTFSSEQDKCMLHSASAACSWMAPVQVHSVFLNPADVNKIKDNGLGVGSLTRQTSLLLIIRNVHDIIKQTFSEVWVIRGHSWIYTNILHCYVCGTYIWLKNQHKILIHWYLLLSQKQIL